MDGCPSSEFEITIRYMRIPCGFESCGLHAGRLIIHSQKVWPERWRCSKVAHYIG